MTVIEGVVAVLVAVGSGGAGAVLVRFVNRDVDRAKTKADTAKALAEATQIEGASWSDLLKQYREEVLGLRRECLELREDYDTLDDHLSSLEHLMRAAGLPVPDRPMRKAN